MRNYRNHFVVIVLLVFVLILSACTRNTPTEITQQPVITTPSVDVIPTIIPTEKASEKVIIVAPAGSDMADVEMLRNLLSPLIDSSGLELVMKESLRTEEMDNAVKVVIVLAGVPNLLELANARSDVQFISLDETEELLPTANLSIMVVGELDLQRQAFLAGYLASVITPDYRVGVLASANDRLGQITTESFFVGAQYFCGLCNSRFGPIEYYPKVAYITDTNAVSSWQPAVDLLLGRAVKTVFVQKELQSPDLLAYLFQNDMQVISPMATPTVISSEDWLVTLRFDPDLDITNLWEDLLAGTGGFELGKEIDLVMYGSADISEGRLQLIHQTMDALMNGYIVPAIIQ